MLTAEAPPAPHCLELVAAPTPVVLPGTHQALLRPRAFSLDLFLLGVRRAGADAGENLQESGGSLEQTASLCQRACQAISVPATGSALSRGVWVCECACVCGMLPQPWTPRAEPTLHSADLSLGS